MKHISFFLASLWKLVLLLLILPLAFLVAIVEAGLWKDDLHN